jgi:hypothetical protein
MAEDGAVVDKLIVAWYTIIKEIEMSELNYLEINAREEKSREKNSDLAFFRAG